MRADALEATGATSERGSVPRVTPRRFGGLGGVMSVNVKGTCVPKQLRHMLSLPLQCHLASSDAARTRAARGRTFYNRKQLTE